MHGGSGSPLAANQSISSLTIAVLLPVCVLETSQANATRFDDWGKQGREMGPLSSEAQSFGLSVSPLASLTTGSRPESVTSGTLEEVTDAKR
jgi:hypothetical protein